MNMKPQFIPVHIIRRELDDIVCNNLPAFHAITGCDTTSQFSGYGRRKALNVYINNASLLNRFGKEDKLTSSVLSEAEKFVIQLYSPGSTETSITALRVSLFMQKNYDVLPPSKNVLELHLRRAHLQANT